MAIMQIPITKGKGFLEVDTDALPEKVFIEAMLQGLKALLGRGMSKVAVANLEGEELEKAQQAAMEIAAKNLQKCLDGTIKLTGEAKAKTSKQDKAVTTEAMRIARNKVRDAIKAAGKKLSHFAAKDITAAARELVAGDPSITEEAKANLARASEAPKTIDLAKILGGVGLKENADKVKQAEEKKKSTKARKTAGGGLSATAAATVKGRKPAPRPEAH